MLKKIGIKLYIKNRKVLTDYFRVFFNICGFDIDRFKVKKYILWIYITIEWWIMRLQQRSIWWTKGKNSKVMRFCSGINFLAVRKKLFPMQL